MTGTCLVGLFSLWLIVTMYRQIDKPDLIHLANMTRDERKYAMTKRIYALIAVWLFVAVFFACYTLYATPFG